MYVSAGKFHGQGCPMKCNTVRTKLAGYFDDAVTGGARVEERVRIRQHLEGCGVCRQELERFRKLAVMLSRVPKKIPSADLAVRIKVAAAQAQRSQDWPSRMRRMKDRAEILLDNVFRPLTVPATGGFLSAILVFVLVLQMIVPGTTLRAVQNDVALNLMRPAELVSLSDYPQAWAPERSEEHTSELQSQSNLVCRLLLEKKKYTASEHSFASADITSSCLRLKSKWASSGH